MKPQRRVVGRISPRNLPGKHDRRATPGNVLPTRMPSTAGPKHDRKFHAGSRTPAAQAAKLFNAERK